MAAILLVSCNSGEKGKTRGDLEEEVREETSPLLVYYLNRNDSAVKGVEFEGGSDVESLLGRMRQMPDDADLKITLGSEVDILSSSRTDVSSSISMKITESFPRPVRFSSGQPWSAPSARQREWRP